MYLCLGVTCKLFFLLSDFNEPELTDSRKIVKYQIWRNSVRCERICFIRRDRSTDGRRQTYWHDEANIRFPQFCDRA